ncbi:MAG: BLUF domain-containing protein [Anaerolineae bacterium]
MTDKIYKLIYVSAAHHSMSEDELFTLLEKSKANNKAKNITGILLYHQENFFQLLEGNKDDVMELYQIIERDKRHTQVLPLIHEVADKRDFPDWSMGFRRLDQIENQNLVEGFNKILEAAPGQKEDFPFVSRKARIFLDNFKENNGLH